MGIWTQCLLLSRQAPVIWAILPVLGMFSMQNFIQDTQNYHLKTPIKLNCWLNVKFPKNHDWGFLPGHSKLSVIYLTLKEGAAGHWLQDSFKMNLKIPHSSSFFFSCFLISFIHMCIQWLGHYSPLSPATHPIPTLLLPSRSQFILKCRFQKVLTLLLKVN
jgi:hypothetical protein